MNLQVGEWIAILTVLFSFISSIFFLGAKFSKMTSSLDANTEAIKESVLDRQTLHNKVAKEELSRKEEDNNLHIRINTLKERTTIIETVVGIKKGENHEKN